VAGGARGAAQDEPAGGAGSGLSPSSAAWGHGRSLPEPCTIVAQLTFYPVSISRTPLFPRTAAGCLPVSPDLFLVPALITPDKPACTHPTIVTMLPLLACILLPPSYCFAFISHQPYKLQPDCVPAAAQALPPAAGWPCLCSLIVTPSGCRGCAPRLHRLLGCTRVGPVLRIPH
jgi:hypothetical protein